MLVSPSSIKNIISDMIIKTKTNKQNYVHFAVFLKKNKKVLCSNKNKLCNYNHLAEYFWCCRLGYR